MNLDAGSWGVMAIVLAAGCQGSSSGGATAAATTSASVSTAPAPPPAFSGVRPHRMLGRHAGIAATLFRAAHDLTLTDAKSSALDAIEASLKSDDEALRAAFKAFRADLIAGAQAGKLDAAKLTADDAAIDKAVGDHKGHEASALDSLHGLLDATERTTVVTAARGRLGEREARMATWIQAKADDGGAVDWNQRRLDKLTTELALDAAQQKQVAAILAKASDPPNAAGMQARWADLRTRTEALLTAFAGDSFDAKTVDLALLPGKAPHDTMDHIDAFVTQLLPVLRPDQRGKLAGMLDRPFGGREMGPARMSAATGGQGRGPIDDMTFPFVEPGGGPGGDAPLP